MLKEFERPLDQGTSVQNYRTKLSTQYYNQLKSTTQTGGSNKNVMMKYSSSKPPLVCMQTNSTCYKSTSKMSVKGVLWHSTGANNPNLKRYV
jgi:hypothetical protein